MRRIRWTPHALKNLTEREIDRAEAELTLSEAEYVVPAPFNRAIFMRRYHDEVLGQEMLLRAVIEDTMNEIVVVTVFKTSKISKYLEAVES